jgi:hypothetical protein
MTEQVGRTRRQPAATPGVLVGLLFLCASEVLAVLFAWHGGQLVWDTFLFVAGLGALVALVLGILVAFVGPLVPALFGRASGLSFRAYTGFAERVKGTVVSDKRWHFGPLQAGPGELFVPVVKFNHCEMPARLDVEIVTGDTTEEYTRLNIDLPRATPFCCRIYPLGTVDWLARIMQMDEDVQVGWEEFDKQFVIKTNDGALARLAITCKVQQELLTLKLWRRPRQTPKCPELTILDNSLRVRIVLLSQVENLMQFYEACGRIYAEMTHAI